MKFNNGGLVYTLQMVSKIPRYIDNPRREYSIIVNARGPVGFDTGCGHLRFTQENGLQDTYRVCSSTTKDRKVHLTNPTPNRFHPQPTVPVVVRIDWSNFDFHD